MDAANLRWPTLWLERGNGEAQRCDDDQEEDEDAERVLRKTGEVNNGLPVQQFPRTA